MNLIKTKELILMYKFKFITLLAVCLLLFGFALPVMAADKSITINPVLLPFKMYHLDYEVSVSEKSSYNVMLIYYDDENFIESLAEILETIFGDSEDQSSYTYGCKIGKRWYTKAAQNGWYYGLEGAYLETTGDRPDSHEFSLGGCFGKRRITDSGYTYDLGLNVAYYDNSEEGTGVAVFFSIQMGYGW